MSLRGTYRFKLTVTEASPRRRHVSFPHSGVTTVFGARSHMSPRVSYRCFSSESSVYLRLQRIGNESLSNSQQSGHGPEASIHTSLILASTDALPTHSHVKQFGEQQVYSLLYFRLWTLRLLLPR